MSTILYLDTSGHTGKVLLSRNGAMIAETYLEDARAQSGQINSMIATVLQQTGIKAQDIAAISLCNGPGSYTGLRVGLSTAKGWAMAQNIPLILHHKLILIAESHLEHFKDFAVVLYARAEEYFVCTYKNGQISQYPQHFFISEIKDLLKTEQIVTLLLTEEKIKEELDLNLSFEMLEEEHLIHTNTWIRLSEERLKQKDFDDIAYSEPFYLKPVFVNQQKK